MTTAAAKRPKVSKAWRKLLCSLPGYDPFAQADGCWFDETLASEYINFIQECCTHIEGAKSGQKFLLEPWQQAIVANLFGWQRIDGLGRQVRRYREAFIYVARKNGKALALDTPLPTPSGWTTMGDVRLGDTLFDDMGEPCRVLEAFTVMHGHECFRVKFSDGSYVDADREHLWTVYLGGYHVPFTLETWNVALASEAHNGALSVRSKVPFGKNLIVRDIVAVEPIPSVPVRCIRVDSPSHLFLAGDGMVPTHNSPMCAAIANAVFFFDDERGQQDYCAAADREQASVVFRHIQGMIENEPEMMSRVTIYKTTRTVEQVGGSYIKVLSADANTKHGGNSHLIIVDELHAQPNRDLVDVLQTSMASANRLQPLMLYITTADYDRPSICNEKYAYACRVRDGVIHDPAFLPVIYEVPKDADWTDEKVWPLANPNLDVSVSRDYLRRECIKARENPAYENTFRRLHMNQITEQAERCIPMEAWDACDGPPIVSPGQMVWAGLDIGATRDFTAFVMIFQGDDGEPMTVEFEDLRGEKQRYSFVRHGYSLVPTFWMPEKPATRNPRAEDQIRAWKKQGFIRTTPGDVVDYEQVAADIGTILRPYALQQLAIDQGFQGTQITQVLQKVYGERVVAFRQGILSMAAPCRELLELMQAGRLRHGGHPVLRWMASNVAAETRGGLIKFSKDKSCEKIDGMTAAAMALGVAMTAPEAPKGSVYEERGIVTIGGDG